MLPLWIIDLRKKSLRRDHFEKLIGEIDHVYIPQTDEPDHSYAAGTSAFDAAVQAYAASCMAGQPSGAADDPETASTASEEANRPTLEEVLDARDKQEANRNSMLQGNYWRYTRMCDYFYGLYIKIEEGKLQQACYDYRHTLYPYTDKLSDHDVAERLYKFQSNLVEEGQQFIKDLRKSNAHPDMKINVVILGDLTEEFTRLVFPATASMLQKEKGRILPHHIHQGMEIIGMLYIPSDIHTRKVNIRRSMQRTLLEIDVQYRVNDLRGFDHMMFYQDVQNRTECAYPLLDDEQLAAYLMQCLVHLYLACDETHPLLSGTSSADTFYFSMGASSVFFDTENEDLKSRHRLAMELIRAFKSEGDQEQEAQDLTLLEPEAYQPESFFDEHLLHRLDSEEVEMDEPSPHPVRQFMAKYLKRYYYNLYLRYFTSNLMHRTIRQIDACTHASLTAISNLSNKKRMDAEKTIAHNLHENVLSHLSANDGGLPRLIRLFKEMQELFSEKRQDIQPALKQKFWRQIEENQVRKELMDKFTEYHSAYEADIKQKTGGTHQLDLKKQTITELNGILSQESTLLSRIARSVLLGITGALAGIPMLDGLSPQFIDLGPVERYSEYWAIGLFLLPAAMQVISYVRYLRKKRKAVNDLKAMYLHDAYARVANRIESEIKNFYDKVIALGDRYLKRCESIRDELGKDYAAETSGKPTFPQSLFNQPLIGGQFGNETLLPEKEANDTEVRINYIRYKLDELTKTEYFLLINQHKDTFYGLFHDVKLCEGLIRRVNQQGTEELVTKEQQELEQQTLWEKQLKKFHEALSTLTKDTVMPREHATVGEKLRHYCVLHPEKGEVMKPLLTYAASNGEVTSSADREFADLKFNDPRIEKWLCPFLSTPNLQKQTDEYNRLFQKYIFVTRWRCYDHFNLNRILPTEDFDEKMRQQCIYEEEQKAKASKERTAEWKQNDSITETGTFAGTDQTHEATTNPSPPTCNQPRISSLLLWSLCPDDSSSEWLRLFHPENYTEAYNGKNTFRKILNQND